MALASGSRIGAYEVLALLGAGGMGEVYRARDMRFLVFKLAANSDGSSAPTSIVVVQHFDQELKRLVGR